MSTDLKWELTFQVLPGVFQVKQLETSITKGDFNAGMGYVFWLQARTNLLEDCLSPSEGPKAVSLSR